MAITLNNEQEKALRDMLSEMDKVYEEGGMDSYFEGQREVLIVILDKGDKNAGIDRLVSEWNDV
jgi:hypothetical protein